MDLNVACSLKENDCILKQVLNPSKGITAILKNGPQLAENEYKSKKSEVYEKKACFRYGNLVRSLPSRF